MSTSLLRLLAMIMVLGPIVGCHQDLVSSSSEGPRGTEVDAKDGRSNAGAPDQVAQARQCVSRLLERGAASAFESTEAEDLLAGEALQWGTVRFGPPPATLDSVMLTGGEGAVARVIIEGESRDIDLYLYLSSGSGEWRVHAARSMTMTNMVEMALAHFQENEDAGIPVDEQLRRQLRLTLLSDAELREWFSRNQSSLDELVASARSQLSSNQIAAVSRQEFPDLVTRLRALALNSVVIVDSGNVEVCVGGLVDNTVGFIYSPANAPPPVDPREYIWVEPLGHGWFLFRTT